MFEELEQESILENKAKPHPNISFVYIRGTGYFCAHHPSDIPMNRGAMKQHLRGKQHGIDFETGKKINKKHEHFLNISKQIKNDINQKENDSFTDIKEKIDAFRLPRIVKDMLLAKHGLEGELEKDVSQWLMMLQLWKSAEEQQLEWNTY